MLCRYHKDTRARRLNFSALMIDLDTFKHINDTFGHAKGDEVICEVASILKHMIRPTDFAGHWAVMNSSSSFPAPRWKRRRHSPST